PGQGHVEHLRVLGQLAAGGQSDRKPAEKRAKLRADSPGVEPADCITKRRCLQIARADADGCDAHAALALQAIQQGERQSAIDADAHGGIEYDAERLLALSGKLHVSPPCTSVTRNSQFDFDYLSLPLFFEQSYCTCCPIPAPIFDIIFCAPQNIGCHTCAL